MRNFTDDELDRLNGMWADAKEGNQGTKGLYLAIAITAVLLLTALGLIFIEKHGLFNKHGIKGYTEIKREEL